MHNPNWGEQMEAEFRASLTASGYVHEVEAEFGVQDTGVFNKDDIDRAQTFYNYAYNPLDYYQEREAKELNNYPDMLLYDEYNPAPFNRDRMFVNDVEFALWGVYNSKNKPKWWTFNRQSWVEKCVMDTTVQSSKLHPTMKDIKVIRHLVELLSNEWDLVFDPFMWSWTTAVACKELNRNYVGCEIDPKYCEIIEKRLNEVKQKLF